MTFNPAAERSIRLYHLRERASAVPPASASAVVSNQPSNEGTDDEMPDDPTSLDKTKAHQVTEQRAVRMMSAPDDEKEVPTRRKS